MITALFIATIPITNKSFLLSPLISQSRSCTHAQTRYVSCLLPAQPSASTSVLKTFSFSLQDEIAVQSIEQSFRALEASYAADLVYVTYSAEDSPLKPAPSWKAILHAFEQYQITGRGLDRLATRLGIPTLLSLHPGMVRNILFTLSNELGLKSVALASLLAKRPDLLSTDSGQVCAAVRTLKQLGLRLIDMRQIFANCPRLLLLPTYRLHAVVDILTEPPVELSRICMRSLLRRTPWVLSIDPVLEITPALAWLQQRKYAPGIYILANPQILASSPDSLQDVYDFLEKEVSLKSAECEAILRSFPLLLTASIEQKLRPAVKFMSRKLQLDRKQIAEIIRAFPSTLTIDVENNMKPVVDYFHSRGVRNVFRIIKGLPPILGYDIEKGIRPKLDFLEHELGLPVFNVVRFPGVFSYQLDDRIRPRTLFVIKSGSSISEIDLKRIVGTTDQHFCEHVVKANIAAYEVFKETLSTKPQGEVIISKETDGTENYLPQINESMGEKSNSERVQDKKARS